ncbi:hypothetical protein PNEG_01383 [Pneumocystis murina B123]|uniref:FACT complex subunit POB3 n=1 Tax=Pneumocystis murina (strain B123) TaxID=1069680 RepID=M7PI11_PNEMU|nr:hypothetical protein PNEG_01383 [Pneumocystis murina B123]EMR10104.1 hypothetical protein PNEG_01383 [Pneumocystis murina B123]
MPEVIQYDDIYLNQGKIAGRLRLASSGLGWKESNSDELYTVPASDIRKAQWSRAARGYELKLTLRNGGFVQLDGFDDEDLDTLRKTIKKYFNITLEQREHSLKGWNWGKTEFSGSELLFNVSNKPAFEIPLSNISNTNLSGKNEVSLEFLLPRYDNDTEKLESQLVKGVAVQEDQLVEMRFYIPGTTITGNQENSESVNNANLFYETLKDKADIGQVSGESIVSFSDVLFLTPRGRYDVDMYSSFLRLRGKTYDYKIYYSSFVKLFLLPKPDDMHIVFVMGLDLPLRQGQTEYPFLVIQFMREEEMEVELNIEDSEFQEKYSEKLKKKYDQPAYEVVSQIFYGLTGKKVITPSTFRSYRGHAAVKCSMKASEGNLFCLDKSFLFIPKPSIWIPISEISYVTLFRINTSVSASRTFDLTFSLKGGAYYQFSNINREEQKLLEDFMKSKNIKIENDLNEDSQAILDALDDELSDDDNSSIPIRSNDDDESPDDDFQIESDSDVAEEYDENAESSKESDNENDNGPKLKKMKSK